MRTRHVVGASAGRERRARRTRGRTPATARGPADDDLPGSRAATGEWTAPIGSAGSVMQHVVLLPHSSKVLYFEDGAGAKVLDTVTGAITNEPAGSNLFCAGQTILSDGRVLVLGGDAAGDPEYGEVATNIYDPVRDQWTRVASMTALRWYPTGTKLPDGRVLATSGLNPAGTVERPEIFDPARNTWTMMAPSSSQYVPLYPHMFVLADGRIVETGAFGGPDSVHVLNPATQTWSTVDSRVIDAGSSVMYRPGRILRAGSSGGPGGATPPASSAAYVLDMNAPSPALRQVKSMASPRAFFNLTTLPDGNVLATSGETNHDYASTNPAYQVHAAELWSPTTEQWTTLASNRTPRFYHSTALLLPDGRVLVGGGWGPTAGGRQYNYEIFSPPYLFKGARPAITAAPGSAGYGSTFPVTTPDAGRIAVRRARRAGRSDARLRRERALPPTGFHANSGWPTGHCAGEHQPRASGAVHALRGGRQRRPVRRRLGEPRLTPRARHGLLAARGHLRRGREDAESGEPPAEQRPDTQCDQESDRKRGDDRDSVV